MRECRLARVVSVTTKGDPRMNVMMTRPVAEDERFIATGADSASDYHRRRALEERERAELKRVDFEMQCSPLNSADLRIRAWENVHRLSMPSDPNHPVLVAIAEIGRAHV